MRQLVVSLETVDDLEGIALFISKDKPSAAESFISRIWERFELLSQHPYLGEARPEFGPNRRSCVVGNYVVYYDVTPSELRIARVLHAARDLRALGW
jgi:toxin ParE1/3/4